MMLGHAAPYGGCYNNLVSYHPLCSCPANSLAKKRVDTDGQMGPCCSIEVTGKITTASASAFDRSSSAVRSPQKTDAVFECLSPFPECFANLVCQWLYKILEWRAICSLNKNISKHSSRDAVKCQASEFVGSHSDTDRIVCGTGLLISRRIR